MADSTHSDSRESGQLSEDELPWGAIMLNRQTESQPTVQSRFVGESWYAFCVMRGMLHAIQASTAHLMTVINQCRAYPAIRRCNKVHTGSRYTIQTRVIGSSASQPGGLSHPDLFRTLPRLLSDLERANILYFSTRGKNIQTAFTKRALRC